MDCLGRLRTAQISLSCQSVRPQHTALLSLRFFLGLRRNFCLTPQLTSHSKLLSTPGATVTLRDAQCMGNFVNTTLGVISSHDVCMYVAKVGAHKDAHGICRLWLCVRALTTTTQARTPHRRSSQTFLSDLAHKQCRLVLGRAQRMPMVLALASAFRRRQSDMAVSYARACHSCVWYVQIRISRSCARGCAPALAFAAGTCARPPYCPCHNHDILTGSRSTMVVVTACALHSGVRYVQIRISCSCATGWFVFAAGSGKEHRQVWYRCLGYLRLCNSSSIGTSERAGALCTPMVKHGKCNCPCTSSPGGACKLGRHGGMPGYSSGDMADMDANQPGASYPDMLGYSGLHR